MKQNKQDTVFNKLLRDINAGDIPNVLLLFGEEAFLTDWAVSRLIDRYVNEAVKELDLVRFEPGELAMEDLVDACQTLPMFSERKVVVIDSAYDIMGREGSNREKDFIEYAKTISGPCLLIIRAVGEKANNYVKGISSKGKRRKGGGLQKMIEGFGRSYEFAPIDKDDLTVFIVKRFRSEGKEVSGRAVDTIIANSGYMNKNIDYALYNLESDIKKIAAHSGGDTVTEEDVLAGLSDNLEHAVFKMLDAVSENKKDVALQLLHDMLLTGADEHGILALIANQLELMLEVKQLSGEGRNENEIAKHLKVHDFRVSKANRFQKRYDENELRRMLLSAFETDDRIKSGELEASLALELLVAGL